LQLRDTCFSHNPMLACVVWTPLEQLTKEEEAKSMISRICWASTTPHGGPLVHLPLQSPHRSQSNSCRQLGRDPWNSTCNRPKHTRFIPGQSENESIQTCTSAKTHLTIVYSRVSPPRPQCRIWMPPWHNFQHIVHELEQQADYI
jgi:hypothetical protein